MLICPECSFVLNAHALPGAPLRAFVRVISEYFMLRFVLVLV